MEDYCKLSMYDIMLKEHNKWLGHSTGKLWHTFPKRHQAILKKRLGFHYVPPDYLEDNWMLNISSNHFANYSQTLQSQQTDHL